MKKLNVFLAATLIAASTSTIAHPDKKGEKSMDMKMLDANGDGMISKDEFMKHHEMMWDKMKKNPSGMVDMKEMEMMHKEKHGAKKDAKTK
ncbi:hypothetical protein [Massilia cavernae]|uniref:EF-hand domain-containing protein n=1 Tax=Massilia cavernae TaxID=2320864 RepID=A0A418Y5E3_9BURK|nr:hypothetical protein [Massilia cavernae]RJG21701.1 hypothetical protein D3872_06455 [Massilia cavernae]